MKTSKSANTKTVVTFSRDSSSGKLMESRDVMGYRVVTVDRERFNSVLKRTLKDQRKTAGSK